MAEDDPLERFHHAWFAPELRLLGFRCRPFCLGHLLTFQALRLPFARLEDPEVSVSLSDFFLALRVCARARWPFQLDGLEGAPSPAEGRAFARLATRPKAFDRALTDFLHWMVLCSRGPELCEPKDGDSQPLTAPLVLTFATRLVRNGWTEERVFTMPLSLVRSYAAALSEQDGGAEFVTPEMIALMKEHEKTRDEAQMTEDELFTLAVKELGESRARDWYCARLEHQKPATPSSIFTAGGRN